MGAPVWKPDPNLEGGPTDTPQTLQPTPPPAANLETPMEMILYIDRSLITTYFSSRLKEQEGGCVCVLSSFMPAC
jgi:hypothetical protein